MNRIVRGMIVMLVGVTAQIVVAQAGDICSGEHIANRVGEVYNAYTEHGSSDLESSLNGIASLESQLDAIYSECNEVRYQAYVEEGRALLEDLREGGYVIYVRHARTDNAQEDTDLASCETQRNLSEQGRLDAASIGETWATLAVPVGELISTEYCRTRESAQLAFGEPNIIPKAQLEQALETLLAIPPAEGMNTVISIPEDIRFNEGDALVYRPLGGPMGDQGYELVTRISFLNWFDLARIAAEPE